MNKTYHFDEQKQPQNASDAVFAAMIGSKIYHFSQQREYQHVMSTPPL